MHSLILTLTNFLSTSWANFLCLLLNNMISPSCRFSFWFRMSSTIPTLVYIQLTHRTTLLSYKNIRHRISI